MEENIEQEKSETLEETEIVMSNSPEVISPATEEDDLPEYTIKSDITESYLPLRRVELDEKEYKRFIGSVERLVRSSSEYKEWVKFCRTSLGATTCIFTGETLEETDDIEIHHYPFTLYDIVKIAIDNRMYSEKPFSSFDIALEVIKLHFELKVGFVPLAGTIHKKYHKGFVSIPINYVSGNYKGFVREYELDIEMKEKLTNAMKINESADVYRMTWNDGNTPQVNNTIGYNIDLNDNTNDSFRNDISEDDEIDENPSVDIGIDLSSMMNNE